MLKGRLVAVLLGFAVLLALPATASALKFSPPTGSPIEGLPFVSGIVSADFNNDGRDDLASSSSSGGGDGIAIRLAQSDGTWTAASVVDSGYSSYSLATGDFNNDNKADLVSYRIGNIFTPVAAFFGNGNGSFGSEVPIGAPWFGPRSLGSWNALTTGDLNNDGNDDVVFPLSHGDFAFSLSNGLGGFAAATSQHIGGTPSGTDDRFSSAAIGDFNDDGHQDVALGMSPASLDDPLDVAVHVMLGDGAGSFNQAPIYGFPIAQPAGYVGKISSLATGNFDGQGGDDLALSAGPAGVLFNEPGKGTVQVFFGDSTFGLSAGSQVFQRDDRPGPVLARDFDNDNLTDLAWLERVQPNGPSTEQVAIARGAGDGIFSPSPETFYLATNTVASTELVSGDFNLDGAWDFAAGFGNSGTIRLLQNEIDPITDRDSIDFGDVLIDSGEKLQSVYVTNAGGPTGAIGEVTITGDDASSFALPSTSCEGENITAVGCLQGVEFDPIARGSFEANLHITFEGSSEVLDIPLAANVVAPEATFSPNPLNFGQAWINTSKTRTLEVTSSGDAPLFISDLTSITGPEAGLYEITSDDCSNHSLAPGDSCFIDIKLNADSSTGDFESARINLINDGYLSPQNVYLYYTGINPGVTVSPSSWDFGPVAVGDDSTQSFTLSSTGTTDLEIDEIEVESTIEGDFSLTQSGSCPGGTFAPDNGCQIEVTFDPSNDGGASRTGQIVIWGNLQGPVIIQLTGTRLKPVDSYSTDEIAFGEVPVGSTVSETVTVTNSGTAPMTIQEAWLDGPGDDWQQFSIDQDTCTGASVAVGQTCSYRLSFNPTERGNQTAYSAVWFEGADGQIELTGKGIDPEASFDTASHDFGTAPIGIAGSESKHTFTLNSTGLDPVTVQSLAIEGADAGSFELADPGACATSIPVNDGCQITVSFDPPDGSPGPRSAVLSAETNGGTIEASLTGTALALTYKAKVTVKAPKKVKVKKKTRIKVKVAVTNTGTGTLSGAALKYTARQGKTGKAKVSKRVSLPGIAPGKTIRKNITINLRKSALNSRKLSIKLNFNVVRQNRTIASRSGTTRLDFGQSKPRRPRDVSNS